MHIRTPYSMLAFTKSLEVYCKTARDLLFIKKRILSTYILSNRYMKQAEYVLSSMSAPRFRSYLFSKKKYKNNVVITGHEYQAIIVVQLVFQIVLLCYLFTCINKRLCIISKTNTFPIRRQQIQTLCLAANCKIIIFKTIKQLSVC